jgi:hypothetical protein
MRPTWQQAPYMLAWDMIPKQSVLLWDLETVPDLAGFATANGHDGKSDDEIRTAC